MATYKREASGWSEQGVWYSRTASGWTSQGDGGYVWDGSAWVQFQPLASSDLLPPESLVVLPSDISASATWVNPEQDEGNEPTHVQIRIPETTTVWTEIAMDVAAYSVGFLTPDTTYQWQIRYIIRDEAEITKTSPITEVFFTTDALSGPGTPAADPGGSGPDTTIPWGPPPGGTAGPVGGPGCWWEYIVQTATTPASGALTWSDTAVTGSFDGDAGSLEIDFVDEGLTCGQLARMKYRENCDGTPGDYAYGDPFVIVCDWGSDCGGLPGSLSATLEPFSDAIQFMPKVCAAADDPLQIEDALATGVVYGKLGGFFGVSQADNDGVIVGKTSNGTLSVPVVAGKVGDFLLWEDTQDTSFSLNVMLAEVPGGAGGGSGVAPTSMPLVRWGKNVAISAVFDTTSTWVARASWIDATGAHKSITGTTPLALDAWVAVTLTSDADGDKILYANTDVEGTEDSGTNMAYADAGIGQDLEVYLNEAGRIRRVATWERVLSPEEIGVVTSPKTSPWVAGVEGSLTDTVSYPTGITGSDEVLYITALRDYTLSGSESFVTPAGWTKIGTAQNGAAWYKIATGSESGSVTVTGSTQTEMFLVRNIDTDYPLGLFGEHFVGQFNSTNVDSAQLNLLRENFPIENSSIMSLGSMTAASTTDFTGQVVGGSNYIPPANIQSLAQLNSTALAFGVWCEQYETIQGPWDPVNGPNTLYSSNPTNDGNTGGYSVQLVFTPHAPGRDTSVPKIVGVTFDQRTSSTPVHTVPQGTSDGDLIVVMAPLCGGATAVDANMTLAVAAGSIDGHVAYTTYASAHGSSYSPSGTFVTSVSRYSVCIRILDADGTLIDAQTGTSTYGANSQYPLNTSDLTLTPTGAGQIALFNGHCRSRTDGQEFDDANGWTAVQWTGGFVSGGSDGTGMISYKDVGASGAITVPTHTWISTPADPHYPFAFHGAVFS